MNKVEYWHSQSYLKEFQELLDGLKQKYGHEFFNLSGIGDQLDQSKFAKKYFGQDKNTADTSVDPNSNVGLKNIVVYSYEMSKPIELIGSYYRMWKGLKKKYGLEYANLVVEEQLSGGIYINDFHGFQSNRPYCYNYSTLDTAINGVPKQIDGEGATPSKHLSTFLEHLQLFCVHAGASTLGAVGLSDLLITLTCYFNKVLKTQSDAHVRFASQEDCYIYFREKITNFIWFLNQPNRISQSLFSNVSVYDEGFLKEFSPFYQIEIDGEIYGAKIELIKEVQEIFLQCMNSEYERRICTFPVTTACFSLDENKEVVDEAFLDIIQKYNKKFCFINLYGGKTSSLSACCRLRSDKESKHFNLIGSGSVKLGSIGVVSINLPRLAKLSKADMDLFKVLLKERIIMSQRVNQIKRSIIQRSIKNNMSPLYNMGYINIKTQYSSIGINGLYEAVKEFGLDISQEEGLLFAKNIITFMNSENDKLSEEMGCATNLEMIPAENVAIKLAQKDKILGYNNEYELYSNQFIPLTHEANILDRVKTQGSLDEMFSGGSILHIGLGQFIDDDNLFKNFIKTAFKKGVIYFAFNYLLGSCNSCRKTFKVTKKQYDDNDVVCVCGSSDVDCALRIVGFIRKIKSWAKKRKEEGEKRKFYETL